MKIVDIIMLCSMILADPVQVQKRVKTTDNRSLLESASVTASRFTNSETSQLASTSVNNNTSQMRINLTVAIVSVLIYTGGYLYFIALLLLIIYAADSLLLICIGSRYFVDTCSFWQFVRKLPRRFVSQTKSRVIHKDEIRPHVDNL